MRNGVINILKPKDMTSFDVVAYIRGISRIKKVGHTGTLDPSAVGVLPICVGSATKMVDNIAGKMKKYRAEVTLGIKTNTGDIEGEVISNKEWKSYVDVDNFEAEINKVLINFVGNIEQIPPMYSAIKINGKKLYELARKGIEVERKPRQIFIESINLISYNLEKGTFLIDVVCSKGTYIRTLCEDIGDKIGSGAFMSFLVRTRVGEYYISDSITLDSITKDFFCEEEI